MKYVGVDLHKKTIVLAVVGVVAGKRRAEPPVRFGCDQGPAIVEFFRGLGPFQVAVEATASYEWFLKLIEQLASRIVLVHPKKMRIIAESRRKTDKFDARVLAEFLALDELPEAWRPTPRVREHRALVRQRDALRRRITGLKCRIRHVLGNYNADIPYLFTLEGRRHLAQVALSPADRFVVDQCVAALDFQSAQQKAVDKRLVEFAESANIAEREARAVLATMPGVGHVTINVVLSELGDIRRFRSASAVVQYAGLAPGVRESAGKRHDLGISKEGSPILRWAMVELAWRMVNRTRRWSSVYEHHKLRSNSKKAIVVVARRLLVLITAMLRSGRRYNLATEVLLS